MSKKFKIILSIAVFLLAVRIALPFIAVNQINKSLDGIEGYHGSVNDVDLALYRGGFKVKGIEIFEELSANESIPMVLLKEIDFSIHWKSLFKGSFVGEVYIDSLQLNLTVREKGAEVDSSNSRLNFIKEVQNFNPIQINILEIKNSSIAYKDPTSSPQVDVSLTDFYLKAENLGNVVEKGEVLPASLIVRSNAMETGSVDLDVQLNYLKEIPDFDVNVKIENVSLPRFNNFFEAYGNFDIEEGELNFYSEMAARDGEITGYVKPLIENSKIAPADSTDGLLQKAYEGVLEVGSKIFENSEKDQIGTRVGIEGSMKNTDADVLEAVWNLIKNAFVEAYSKELEYSIDFNGKRNK